MRYILVGLVGFSAFAFADDLDDKFKDLVERNKALSCKSAGPAQEADGIACRELKFSSLKLFFADAEEYIDQAFKRKLDDHDPKDPHAKQMRELLRKAHQAWLTSRNADVALALSKFDPQSLDYRRGIYAAALGAIATRGTYYKNPNAVQPKTTAKAKPAKAVTTDQAAPAPAPTPAPTSTSLAYEKLYSEVDTCIMKEKRTVEDCSVPYLAGTDVMIQQMVDSLRQKGVADGWSEDRLNLFTQAHDRWIKSRDADAEYQAMAAIKEHRAGVRRYYRATLNGKRETRLIKILEWTDE